MNFEGAGARKQAWKGALGRTLPAAGKNGRRQRLDVLERRNCFTSQARWSLKPKIRKDVPRYEAKFF
jgi:hypothetical protein